LKGLGADSETSEALVFAAWKECAGPLIVERTEVVGYSESRLIIAVADATWRAHLVDLSPRIIARLNGTLGDGSVKFIDFRIDPSACGNKGSGHSTVTTKSQAEAPSSIVTAANCISDTELRDSFLAAAAVYLDKNK
jgi:hypothetical protein